MKTVDFTHINTGTLVKFSPHWHKETNYKPYAKRIGIIVDKRFYNDSKAGVLCWPVVHFEGEMMGHHCHPVNVVPYRKTVKTKWIEAAGDCKKPVDNA